MQSNDTTIVQLFSDWKQWPVSGQPVLVKQFSQGKNHRCFLIRSGQQHLVLKKFTSPQKSAIHIQQWASKLSISPNILFANKDFSLCLMEYIAPQKISDEVQITQLANALKTLHNPPIKMCNVSDNRFDLFSICSQYLVNANKQTHDIHARLLPALTSFINDQTTYRFCHNDLVVENCLFNKKVNFIDWEYAQINNPWFDLASVMVYQNLNNKQSSDFLYTYDKQFSLKISTPIFLTSQVTVLWLDILWHLFKFGPEYLPNLKDKYVKLTQLAKLLGITLTQQS